MKILYIGCASENTTSSHRAGALRRLGHDVVIYDPMSFVNWGRLESIFHYKTGYVVISGAVRARLLLWLKQQGGDYDLVWVDGGHMLDADLIKYLRSAFGSVINYNCDDPTGGRDGMRWLTFRRAICEYTICVVVRRDSEVEYPLYGAKRVFRVFMSADEVAHAPRVITPEIFAKWKSDVAFVGTWMPERGPFALELTRLGVPLSIWGNRWERAPEWSKLKSFWRGPAVTGDSYAYAIQCARINLGLLSKGNRDLHTQRSAEIPSLGGVFCAEKTDEHLMLYRDGIEAIFWADFKECAKLVRAHLENDLIRHKISEAGHCRFLSSDLRNQVVLGKVLESL